MIFLIYILIGMQWYRFVCREDKLLHGGMRKEKNFYSLVVRCDFVVIISVIVTMNCQVNVAIALLRFCYVS